MERQELENAFCGYKAMAAMLKTHSYEEILNAVSSLADITPEVLERRPMGGYSKGMTSGAYQFVLQDLLKNIQHYDWLYSRLEDDASRLVLGNLMGYRIFPAQSFLKAAYDEVHPQYFDKSIISCGKDEVFVDCGGFTGDTTEEFIRQFGNYKRIFVYEPNQDNYQTCWENLAKYPHITVRPCGVGERSNRLAIESSGSGSTFMREQKSPDSQGIRIVSLDEDIRETITFLKMDVEGFEIPALLGAKRHIRDDFPKLAICAYHIVSDLWEIPRLIDSIHPGYRFYIRHYNFPQNWETVLYAIPPENVPSLEVRIIRKNKRIAATPFNEGWQNSHLVKDCGVLPYLLHKNHHCEAIMVGAKIEADYPNAKYVPGLNLEFLPDDVLQAKLKYLKQNAGQIDCLMLHGPYEPYFSVVECYKKYNPRGKINLVLDANSSWMDRIQWDTPEFRAFMDRCDVISASGRTMQRHLNEKWPWPIEFIPNGFYNFSSRPWSIDFPKKENIVLTVGRLGTPQKATDVLLEAFAKIADQIPDWELHLAGSVEGAFNPWLDRFWARFPNLKSRIRFLGSISDRDTLYRTYQRAKIFALPSTFEGGTPNVIAEALFSGDVIAATKIDEYQDAIGNGRCGLASEIGDTDGFADILLRLCQNERLDEMCREAYAYAQEVYDMERIAARLYLLIFGGEV